MYLGYYTDSTLFLTSKATFSSGSIPFGHAEPMIHFNDCDVVGPTTTTTTTTRTTTTTISPSVRNRNSVVVLGAKTTKVFTNLSMSLYNETLSNPDPTQLPPVWHDQSTAAAVGNIGYVFGGKNATGNLQNSLRKLEHTQGEVRMKHADQMVHQDWTARAYAASTALGSSVYVAGGYSSTTPLKDVWRCTPDFCVFHSNMTANRTQFAMVGYNETLWAMGGFDHTGSVLKSVERWNENSQTWEYVNNMPGVLFFHSAVVLAGRIVVLGGSNSTGPFTQAYVFNGTAWATMDIANWAGVSGVHASSIAANGTRCNQFFFLAVTQSQASVMHVGTFHVQTNTITITPVHSGHFTYNSAHNPMLYFEAPSETTCNEIPTFVTPTSEPTVAPTSSPTVAPTPAVTGIPTAAPTSPTNSPTHAPTPSPTQAPTPSPADQDAALIYLDAVSINHYRGIPVTNEGGVLYNNQDVAWLANTSVAVVDKVAFVFGGYGNNQSNIMAPGVLHGTVRQMKLNTQNVLQLESVAAVGPSGPANALLYMTPRMNSASCAHGGYAYMSGGEGENGVFKDIWRCDQTGCELVNEMNQAYYGHAMVTFRQEIYMIGGMDETGQATNHCYKYNSVRNDVRPCKEPFPVEIAFHSAVTVNDRIVVMGGGNATGGEFAFAGIYNGSKWRLQNVTFWQGLVDGAWKDGSTMVARSSENCDQFAFVCVPADGTSNNRPRLYNATLHANMTIDWHLNVDAQSMASYGQMTPGILGTLMYLDTPDPDTCSHTLSPTSSPTPSPTLPTPAPTYAPTPPTPPPTAAPTEELVSSSSSKRTTPPLLSDRALACWFCCLRLPDSFIGTDETLPAARAVTRGTNKAAKSRPLATMSPVPC